jgi:hypothetical protein
MTQMVEHLCSKFKALSSNPSIAKKEKTKNDRNYFITLELVKLLSRIVKSNTVLLGGVHIELTTYIKAIVHTYCT